MNGGPTKVLVADDEAPVRALLGTILEERGDCELLLAADGQEAFWFVANHHPNMLITDLRMPRMSGEELAKKSLNLDPDLTVLVETGNPTVDGAVRLMRDGVFDFIVKPFSIDDLRQRIDRAMERCRRNQGGREADAIVASLMAALERKDPYLRGHSDRVAEMARSLGSAVGVRNERLDALSWAALVHDVGKIGVPDAILHKPGPLTSAEYAEVMRHPMYSAEIIRPLAPYKGGPVCLAAVLHHHERIDGQGYPSGLSGEEIPVEARVIAVCDAFDAMASKRPYRDALAPGEILARLEEGSGTQFDEDIVDKFLKDLDEYEEHVLCAAR